MPLINCKVELSLKRYERCLLTAATTATFRITDAKLYVPIVTLSKEDNSKLTKLLYYIKDLKDQFIGINIKLLLIK